MDLGILDTQCASSLICHQHYAIEDTPGSRKNVKCDGNDGKPGPVGLVPTDHKAQCVLYWSRRIARCSVGYLLVAVCACRNLFQKPEIVLFQCPPQVGPGVPPCHSFQGVDKFRHLEKSKDGIDAIFNTLGRTSNAHAAEQGGHGSRARKSDLSPKKTVVVTTRCGERKNITTRDGDTVTAADFGSKKITDLEDVLTLHRSFQDGLEHSQTFASPHRLRQKIITELEGGVSLLRWWRLAICEPIQLEGWAII